MPRFGFLFPIELHQLVTWQRVGVWSVHDWDGAWVLVDKKGLPDIKRCQRERLASVMPVYEDDFEVLYALVEDDLFGQQLVSNDGWAHGLVPIASLSGLYPISERGLQLLKGKLDEYLPLGKPLEIDEVVTWDRRLRARSRVEAGTAMVNCLSLEGAGGLSTYLEDEVINAMRTKEPSSSDEDDIVKIVWRTVRYTRQQRPDQRVIPMNDWGFLFDLGRIIQSASSGSDGIDARGKNNKVRLTSFKHVLDSSMRVKEGASLGEAIQIMAPSLHEISDMCRPFDPVTILAFLKCRDLFDRDSRRGAEEAVSMVRQLIGQKREALATGFRLAGIAAGYAAVRSFCDEVTAGDFCFDPVELPVHQGYGTGVHDAAEERLGDSVAAEPPPTVSGEPEEILQTGVKEPEKPTEPEEAPPQQPETSEARQVESKIAVANAESPDQKKQDLAEPPPKPEDVSLVSTGDSGAPKRSKPGKKKSKKSTSKSEVDKSPEQDQLSFDGDEKKKSKGAD